MLDKINIEELVAEKIINLEDYIKAYNEAIEFKLQTFVFKNEKVVTDSYTWYNGTGQDYNGKLSALQQLHKEIKK